MGSTRQNYPGYARQQAEHTLMAWAHLDQDEFGQISRTELAARVAKYDAIIEKIDDLREKISEAIKHRNSAGQYMWRGVIRSRAGVIATYGSDSVAYHRFGGTRSSDRKRSRRRRHV